MDELLKVENLRVSFDSYAGKVRAVRGVSFHLGKGEVLAIVGESGCGKTVSVKAVMRLLDRTAGVIEPGSVVRLEDADMVSMSRRELNQVRGKEISMIFQDSMTSLNPMMTVGKQIVENIRSHEQISYADAKQRAIELLRMVELPDPEERFGNFPHQLSGGMRQRVMIAIALACRPKILIADEPTTALDVTIQAQILELLRGLREKTGMSIILVTHDLGIVANFADRVQVMYAGTVVERGSVREIFRNPRHPYTWALLSSVAEKSRGRKSKLYSLRGTPPDLRRDLVGCPFADRCEFRMGVCLKQAPPEMTVRDGHGCACWLCHELAPKVAPPAAIGVSENE